MPKKLLPIVVGETIVSHAASVYGAGIDMKALKAEMEQENPQLYNTVEAVADISAADESSVWAGAMCVYRLLRQQAEADELNAMFGLGGPLPDSAT
jgi:hypothetical protein